MGANEKTEALTKRIAENIRAIVAIREQNIGDVESCAQCDAEWEDENPFGETETYCCPFIYKGYTDVFRNQRRHKDCPLFELKDWKNL